MTKTPPHHHKNTTTPHKHHHKNTTQPHHHKNTTTRNTTKTPPHHHKNATTKTPPQEQHHKNTTTKTPPKHHHKNTKTPPHHHKNTTQPHHVSWKESRHKAHRPKKKKMPKKKRKKFPKQVRTLYLSLYLSVLTKITCNYEVRSVSISFARLQSEMLYANMHLIVWSESLVFIWAWFVPRMLQETQPSKIATWCSVWRSCRFKR